ncbi:MULTISPECIES: urease accessory protein UreF [Pseudomonas]|uniref:Urease accessory protein UreF n=1 Tax=Pseudomonas quercus TaxID=2722792 RepID=A0ABX0YEW6_9PSED|nr:MULTISPECIES: urease accessory protein UreF [Pseudomonas]MBF7142050.1 urease accessory protein UreF [Pseudomonas sp. LY10J]NJP00588.1 urease accessory protein UreF [Pseudomonas quercus]
MTKAWALLRLASPQLPIGGYSYSQGLEMAVEAGQVRCRATAATWLRDQLELNLCRFDGPVLLAHCRLAADENWPALKQRSEEHRASRETRELHLESRQMGYSLKQLLLGLPELDTAARTLLDHMDEPHLALGWALAARAWGLSPEDALAAWLWGWLENQLAVLMKTLPLGQQAAQQLTSELLPALEHAQRATCALNPTHIGSAPFGLALASMAHERQYSRLFRS